MSNTQPDIFDNLNSTILVIIGENDQLTSKFSLKHKI